MIGDWSAAHQNRANRPSIPLLRACLPNAAINGGPSPSPLSFRIWPVWKARPLGYGDSSGNKLGAARTFAYDVDHMPIRVRGACTEAGPRPSGSIESYKLHPHPSVIKLRFSPAKHRSGREGGKRKLSVSCPFRNRKRPDSGLARAYRGEFWPRTSEKAHHLWKKPIIRKKSWERDPEMDPSSQTEVVPFITTGPWSSEGLTGSRSLSPPPSSFP